MVVLPVFACPNMTEKSLLLYLKYSSISGKPKVNPSFISPFLILSKWAVTFS